MEACLNKMARKSMRLNYFFRFGDAFAQNPNDLKDIGIALASRGHLGYPQKNKCRGSAISYIFGISFADPFLGGCFRLRSKPKRLRRRPFCYPNSLKRASLVRITKNPRKFVGFELVWRRLREKCPSSAIIVKHCKSTRYNHFLQPSDFLVSECVHSLNKDRNFTKFYKIN